jgi:hypothetical protein
LTPPRETHIVFACSVSPEKSMNTKYAIFREHSNGSFLWVEAVEDVAAAKQRLEILAANQPGIYRLWDSVARKFVNPFAKSASA